VVTPEALPIMHFTHVGHLTAIASAGLLSDTIAQRTPSFKVEVGNVGIKAAAAIASAGATAQIYVRPTWYF
jgi:hypothetical protein